MDPCWNIHFCGKTFLNKLLDSLICLPWQGSVLPSCFHGRFADINHLQKGDASNSGKHYFGQKPFENDLFQLLEGTRDCWKEECVTNSLIQSRTFIDVYP